MDSENREPVEIPDDVLTDIYRHAREEFPNECCGWLVGQKAGSRILRARRATNAYTQESLPLAGQRTKERAYVIAGSDLMELNNTLDDAEPPRVIYHSHPVGKAYFSETDQSVARSPWGDGPAYPVQQLVIGIDEERVVEARLFGWDEESEMYVEIAFIEGKEI
jgi:proteasome lid subunit RPN8/RPN11